MELLRRRCKRSFSTFFRAFPPDPNYVFGAHTRAMLGIISNAVKAVEQRQSKYIIINMPSRHGKSDIVSRRLPVWALVRNPRWEIIIGSHNYDIASDMSVAARACFREVGPLYDLNISTERNQVSAWQTTAGGAVYSAGLDGTVTGRGANILIIDDYLKNRRQAESKAERNTIWNSFRSDFMPRRAPYHLVIIVAHRWHEDDLVGRVLEKMDPTKEAYDESFPRFERYVFPAQAEDGRWLFPERFPPDWYASEKASMGDYAWQAQALQEPRPRGGNLLKTGNIQWINVDTDETTQLEWARLDWVRFWDLASSEDERLDEDPDATVGTKVAIHKDWLYVDDVVKVRAAATERDRIIRSTAYRDGPGVPIILEAVAGYKDTYDRVARELEGKFHVAESQPRASKFARATMAEPFFDHGRVKARRAPWNTDWQSNINAFPAGKHDDEVDSLSGGILYIREAEFSFHA